MFSLGDWRARPDRSFVYRLPYSPSLGDVRVSYPPQAPPNTTAFRASLRGNPLVYRFMLNRGDSIYAVRKGLVVIIGDQNAQESKYPLAELSQRILDSSNGLVVFVVNVL